MNRALLIVSSLFLALVALMAACGGGDGDGDSSDAIGVGATAADGGTAASGGTAANGGTATDGGEESGEAFFQVDADPSASGIQSSVAIAQGATFKILWNVNPGDTGPYGGYQGKMAFDPAVVSVVSGKPLALMCSGDQQCGAAGPVMSNEPDDLGQGWIFAGEVIVDPLGDTTDYAGDVYEVELRCVAEGTSPLDLRPPPEDTFGQFTYLAPSWEHPTTTVDGEVVCAGDEGP